MSLIGLDIGTTGCKALAFRLDGGRLSGAYREYDLIACAGHEIDPEEVWRSVQDVLRHAAAGCGGDAPVALAVSSFGESVVPLGAGGEVLHHSILYSDPRGLMQCRALEQALGSAEISKRTGLKPHPMYSVCKIGWYRDCLPGVYEKARRYMMFEDFILWRLGAEPALDYSLASRTMAFDVQALRWDRRILDACGIDGQAFSPAVPSGTISGRINPAVADGLGLPRGLLLVTGGHDQVCAAVGAGVLGAGAAMDGTGTVECIAPVFQAGQAQRLAGSNFAAVPYALPGAYTTYAFNFTGGSLLRWFRDRFAADLAARAAAQGVSAYELLNETAAKSPTDLLVVPHFAGSGTPEMDTDARGAILGLRFETDAPTLYRALMEGVTYEMMLNMQCLRGHGIEIDELRAVGGGARSGLWLGIKAAVTGCRVLALDVEEAGATGAAMLAGVASGAFGSLAEAVPGFVRVKREIEPDPAEQAAYAERYARYIEARSRISGLYGN